ncbi:gtpase crac1b [Anaeramoeba flamelloides]|uniref:Gtpase crac1b n=1 Tax=Anaeramoeba flamelloides TaxID=1746091 RepID=A0ABQ8XSR6_9EUKA|nr:gtpase crac1b [Anaeramoeba flamelloides]
MSSLKVLLVGDKSVGKRNLIITYTAHVFVGENVPMSFESCKAKVTIDKEDLDLQLTSSAILTSKTFPEADCVVMCFAVDSYDSFESLEVKWYDVMKEHFPNTTLALLGTKMDLREDEERLEELELEGDSPIAWKEIEKLAKKLKIDNFYECSSKSGKGLSKFFEDIVKTTLHNKKNKKENEKEIEKEIEIEIEKEIEIEIENENEQKEEKNKTPIKLSLEYDTKIKINLAFGDENEKEDEKVKEVKKENEKEKENENEKKEKVEEEEEEKEKEKEIKKVVKTEEK